MISQLTVKEIKELLAKTDTITPLLDLLKNDSRKSVQLLYQQALRKIEQEKKLRQELEQMQAYEIKYWQEGYSLIAGVDEVGRGPLAGPVVAAAVILDPDKLELFLGMKDSKQLSVKKRQYYVHLIKEHAVAYGIGIVDNTVIDQINIYEATKQAMREAIKQLSPQAEVALVDAVHLDLSIKEESIVKGDQKSLSISSASIIAKDFRDQLMLAYGKKYPEFSFGKNVGYGTKEHLESLSRYGYTPIHRRSFRPICEITKQYS